MKKNDITKVMASVFKALSDHNRLKIIKMLASNQSDTFFVSQIAEKLGISQPAASQHIKVLKNIGIVEDNRKGYRIYYSIDLDTMKKLKLMTDDLFQKAFTKCTFEHSCNGCEDYETCG